MVCRYACSHPITIHKKSLKRIWHAFRAMSPDSGMSLSDALFRILVARRNCDREPSVLDIRHKFVSCDLRSFLPLGGHLPNER